MSLILCCFSIADFFADHNQSVIFGQVGRLFRFRNHSFRFRRRLFQKIDVFVMFFVLLFFNNDESIIPGWCSSCGGVGLVCRRGLGRACKGSFLGTLTFGNADSIVSKMSRKTLTHGFLLASNHGGTHSLKHAVVWFLGSRGAHPDPGLVVKVG